jgi:hypothetical protein
MAALEQTMNGCGSDPFSEAGPIATSPLASRRGVGKPGGFTNTSSDPRAGGTVVLPGGNTNTPLLEEHRLQREAEGRHDRCRSETSRIRVFFIVFCINVQLPVKKARGTDFAKDCSAVFAVEAQGFSVSGEITRLSTEGTTHLYATDKNREAEQAPGNSQWNNQQKADDKHPQQWLPHETADESQKSGRERHGGNLAEVEPNAENHGPILPPQPIGQVLKQQRAGDASHDRQRDGGQAAGRGYEPIRAEDLAQEDGADERTRQSCPQEPEVVQPAVPVPELPAKDATMKPVLGSGTTLGCKSQVAKRSNKSRTISQGANSRKRRVQSPNRTL